MPLYSLEICSGNPTISAYSFKKSVTGSSGVSGVMFTKLIFSNPFFPGNFFFWSEAYVESFYEQWFEAEDFHNLLAFELYREEFFVR